MLRLSSFVDKELCTTASTKKSDLYRPVGIGAVGDWSNFVSQRVSEYTEVRLTG